MKKKYFICSGIIAIAAWLLPSHATTETNYGKVNDRNKKSETVYVDTVDIDSMTVNATDEDSPDVEDDEDYNDQTLHWPQTIVERINNVFKKNKIFNTSTVGMEIYDLTADSTIYEYKSTQLMRPASTLKMIVAVTALDRLETNYTFKTHLAYTGHIDSLTLYGNIYCKGGFDPTIDNSDVTEFADSIAALGIDTIHGNICLDLTMKDKDRLGEGWCWDDDNPVLSPLLVGRKEEFGDRLTRALRQKGIHVDGECKENMMPGKVQTIFTKETSLPTVMRRQLKRSDNLYSESIFYQLAATQVGRGMVELP